MPKRQLVDFTLKLHAETSLALKVSKDDDAANAVWIPISQIEINERSPGQTLEVTMPEWLAIEKGLV